MGQQYEKYGNMKHHVSTIQKNTLDILSSYYPQYEKHIRVKYIPIEWHSFIHDMIDSKMNKSTLTTVPKVRLAANHWLMDCLYYFTNPYGQHIINHVVKTCSKAYEDYVSSHPGFNGHVHFIGFSLGGIIAYDIASMQWSEHEDGLPPWAKGDVSNTPDITVPPLGFKIKSIFTCGSPIAAGLICRGLDYLQFRPPPRTRIHNIFHPFDPLGYRLEPMIHPNYDTVEPVLVDRTKRLPRIPNLGIKSSIATAKPYIQSFWQSFFTVKTESVVTYSDHSLKRKEEELDDDGVRKKRRKMIHQDNKMMIPKDGILGTDGNMYPRLDYVLSENMIDAYASEWIVALKSHFRYWANRDVSHHIVKTLLDYQ
ncbi:hypothetical protein RMATCC62417_09150 [Rhizopus microsporus]|nr:hypothetical protein RMATCC62417_09150 [Rhizopus microsporus]